MLITCFNKMLFSIYGFELLLLTALWIVRVGVSLRLLYTDTTAALQRSESVH